MSVKLARVCLAILVVATSVSGCRVVDGDCSTAMQIAAGVTEPNNDTELRAALDACSSADEWIAAYSSHPRDTTTGDAPSDEAIVALLERLCEDASETTVCADAASSGLF